MHSERNSQKVFNYLSNSLLQKWAMMCEAFLILLLELSRSINLVAITVKVSIVTSMPLDLSQLLKTS